MICTSSLSSIFMGFCCSTLTLAVPKVSSSSNPLFSALTGSTFFSIFAAFVLCLNDVSDQVQSTAVLTAFLHQSAFLCVFKTTSFLSYFHTVLRVCGFIVVIMHSGLVSTRHIVDLRCSECFQ